MKNFPKKANANIQKKLLMSVFILTLLSNFTNLQISQIDTYKKESLNDYIPQASIGTLISEYQNGSGPNLDGDLNENFWEDGWDLNFDLMGIFVYSIKTKHNVENIFFAIEWKNISTNDSISLYFEDDGTSHDHNLDGLNEDMKMTSLSLAAGSDLELCDYNWVGSWSNTTELSSPNRHGSYGAAFDGTNWTVEISIPLSTGTDEDISVNREETLGFYMYIGELIGIQNDFPFDANRTDYVNWADLVITWGNATDGVAPTINSPDNIWCVYSRSIYPTINWVLADDQARGLYRILINGTPWDSGWKSWANPNLEITPDEMPEVGDWNYTIQYLDFAGNWGIEDTVIVFVESGIYDLHAEFKADGMPVLDGILNEPYWDGDWDVISETRNDIWMNVKHNSTHLLFAIRWENSTDDNFLDLYFEDDGIENNKNIWDPLSGMNTDRKFLSGIYSFLPSSNQRFEDGGFFKFLDDPPAHSWNVYKESDENRDGLYGIHNIDNNHWSVEISIPFQNNTMWDINVNSSERLGFTIDLDDRAGLTNHASYPAYSRHEQSETWADIYIEWETESPTSNSPSSMSYQENSTDHTIDWVLQDNGAAGMYQVLINNTPWENGWVGWENDTNLEVPVDTNIGLGPWNYTIVYNDSLGNYGIPNTVLITITQIPDLLAPLSNSPEDFAVVQNKTSTYIVWILQDNRDPGVYRILVNNTPWDLGWQQWVNNSELEILVNTNLGLGDWNYTIQYRDLAGYWGIEDNVIVTIEKVLDNNIYENNENTDNSLHQDESHWLKFLTNPIYLGGIILFGIGGIVIIFVKKRK